MTQKILEIDNLTVSFDGFKAINQLNFSMDKGELRVIIGPNGAGKTTFLDVITGKVQPTEGRVLFQGKDLRGTTEHHVAQLGIGRKFQTPRVYLNLTVKDNLELACNPEKNVLKTLFGKAGKAEKRNIAGLLETIGLTTKATLPADLLSHGEKQRLEIGMLVAQSPELLLVDEPVAGLTDEETENVGNLLLALAESHSIIVIEHDMEFVRQIARKVTVLHQGSVLYEGSMDQVQNDPKVIEVYLGEAPSISTHQLKFLRIITSLAWADGTVSTEEANILTSRLSQRFTTSSQQQEEVEQELKMYIAQDVPIESILSDIKDQQEKEDLVKLGYEVIKASANSPNQALINADEAWAYQQLIQLLNLPKDRVKQLETEVDYQKS
jgi:urea transport system ATP-binding protein